MAQILMIDLASQPVNLLPDTPGQQVGLYISNTDSSALLADAATLKFQLDDGVAGAGVPRITGIDAITGTPWASAGGFQVSQTAQDEYWDVRVFANFLAGQHATLPGSGSTLLATLTVDTTGVSGGSWSFRMAGLDVDAVDTKYEVSGGGTLFPTASVGAVNIAVVPEPEAVACLTALGLAGMTTWRRLRRGRGT